MWAMEDVSGRLLILCKAVTTSFYGLTEGRAFCDRERPGSGKGVRVGRRVTAAERSGVGQSVLGRGRRKPLTGGGRAFSKFISCKLPSLHTCKPSSEKSHCLDTIPQQIQQPGGVFYGLTPSPTPHMKTHHSLHHGHVKVNISSHYSMTGGAFGGSTSSKREWMV